MVINMERLQKVIAQAGLASRRKAEEFITSGRVKVNGNIVTELGVKVSAQDQVEVDGVKIEKEEKKYLVMNKPRYIVTTANDDKDRATVLSLLNAYYQQYRLFPVGRLDYDTKGLLLLTNDGEFMNTIVGPKSNIEKEYLVRAEGIVNSAIIKQLEAGVVIDGYKTRPAKAKIDSVDKKNQSSLVRIIIKEGKYHQVKRMFEVLGHPVKRLTRVRIGTLELEGLQEGAYRELSIHEVKSLYVLSKK